MLRIAGPDEVAPGAVPELSRVLHPSSGLSSRVALALVAEVPAGPAPDEAPPEEDRLADVRRLDGHPRFTDAHRGRRPSG